MNSIQIADETFVSADPVEVGMAVGDPASWRRWWPDLRLTVVEDRGEVGHRWTVTGSLTGTMEVWLRPVVRNDKGRSQYVQDLIGRFQQMIDGYGHLVEVLEGSADRKAKGDVHTLAEATRDESPRTAAPTPGHPRKGPGKGKQ